MRRAARQGVQVASPLVSDIPLNLAFRMSWGPTERPGPFFVGLPSSALAPAGGSSKAVARCFPKETR